MAGLIFGQVITFVFAAVAVVIISELEDRATRRRWESARTMLYLKLDLTEVPVDRQLGRFVRRELLGKLRERMLAGKYRGRAVRCLDYEGIGATYGTPWAHLYAVVLPRELPSLRLYNTRFHGGLGVESEAFNRRYRVVCDDPRYATAMLHPRMLELALANPAIDWSVDGDLLITWSVGRWRPWETLERLELLIRAANLIPEFVLEDYGR